MSTEAAKAQSVFTSRHVLPDTGRAGYPGGIVNPQIAQIYAERRYFWPLVLLRLGGICALCGICGFVPKQALGYFRAPPPGLGSLFPPESQGLRPGLLSFAPGGAKKTDYSTAPCLLPTPQGRRAGLLSLAPVGAFCADSGQYQQNKPLAAIAYLAHLAYPAGLAYLAYF